MPSKTRNKNKGKKGKGKGNNAAPAQKEKAEKESSDLDVQLELAQLQLSDRPSPRNNGITECTHGFIEFPDGHVCKQVVDELVQTMQLDDDDEFFRRLANVPGLLEARRDEWEDENNSRWIQSYFVAQGTKHILDENDKGARVFAVFAALLEQVQMAEKGDFGKAQAIMELLTAVDHRAAGDRTMLGFLKKRIPCKCLDERYGRVKSQKKTGLCYSTQCTLPLRTTERSKMMTCSQCRMVHYCSRQCQLVDWPFHRQKCKDYAAMRKLTAAGKTTHDDPQLKAIVDKWQKQDQMN